MFHHVSCCMLYRIFCESISEEWFSFLSGGVGAELCSPPVAFTVRKRPQAPIGCGDDIPCLWVVCAKCVSALTGRRGRHNIL